MADYPSINRSAEYDKLIDRLYNSQHIDHGVSLFPTIREVLLFAALLGFAKDTRISLGKRGEPIKWSTFESKKTNAYANEYVFLIALAATRDHNILKSGSENMKLCVQVFEEYANGGLEIITDWVNRRYISLPIDQAILTGLQDEGFIEENIEQATKQDLLDAFGELGI